MCWMESSGDGFSKLVLDLVVSRISRYCTLSLFYFVWIRDIYHIRNSSWVTGLWTLSYHSSFMAERDPCLADCLQTSNICYLPYTIAVQYCMSVFHLNGSLVDRSCIAFVNLGKFIFISVVTCGMIGFLVSIYTSRRFSRSVTGHVKYVVHYRN